MSASRVQKRTSGSGVTMNSRVHRGGDHGRGSNHTLAVEEKAVATHWPLITTDLTSA